jgi:2-C-methyl-D-erythritol 4-phosphate cytidylyltransferase
MGGVVATVAIVFAAGGSTRLPDRGLPKQFVTVGGRPILAHTLERLGGHPAIDGIYLVAPQDHLERARQIATAAGQGKVLALVPGGATAHHSIIAGLEAARADGVPDDAIVLFHDGVRPVIDVATVSRCVLSAIEHGSAVAAIPAFETIALSPDGESASTVTVRDESFILQAPQAFRFGHAYTLNQRALADGIAGQVVDQAQLNHVYGFPVHLVAGLRGNTKITTAFDLAVFEAIVQSGLYGGIVGRHD